MNDQPSAAELLTAVQDFITQHAMPQLDGHAAFHARVAANVLAIVQRELEQGPANDAAERARLRELLGEDGNLETLNRRLCERIRTREFTPEIPGLIEHLRVTTHAKLAIDQPSYAAYRRSGDPHALAARTPPTRS
jgi:hypothetical protein